MPFSKDHDYVEHKTDDTGCGCDGHRDRSSLVLEGVDGHKYVLQSTPGLPDLGGYLKQSGFAVNETLYFKQRIRRIDKRPDEE